MKKTTTKIFALSLFGLFSSVMIGQNLQHRGPVQFGKKIDLPAQELTPSGHIRCYTNENEAFLKAQDPNRATTEEFEAWLAPKIAQIKADRAAGRNTQVVYNIPVVIHIVHNGDAIGTGENITDAQARSQINVMNQDYRRIAGTPGGANTTGLAVDVEINFCLAQTDPNGNLTTGIVRHNIAPYSNNVANGAGGADWETNADVQALKAATQWNPDNYLNMWTIRPGGLSLQNGGLDGLLGYAQFPSNSGLSGLNANGGAANTDGVVAGFDAFGTMAENDGTFIMNGSYNLGRTMTHEVGHWLGLRHIWGDPGTGVDGCTVDDFCADTPNAKQANYTCPTSPIANSCPLSPGNDMVQNYMDYTYDYCMDTFTNDQKTRMIAVMQNSPRRNTLNASTACQTPTPIIRFTNPTGSVNENTNCNYTDVTYPVTLGKAATANAVVTFNVAGGGTATQGVDYQIMNPTVTFVAGSTTTQNLTVRVFHDGIAEPTESFVVNLSLNANGGDAVLNAGASSMTISIVDNDVAPIATQSTTVFSADFESAAGWTIIDGDNDGEVWGTVTGLNGYGAVPNTISGVCAFSEKDLAPLGGIGSAANPNNYMISPQITLPAGATSLTLTYIIGAYTTAANAATGYKEHYSVYFSPTAGTAAQILAGAVLENNREIPARSTELRTHNMAAYAGQTGYLVFRHHNSAGNGILLLDTPTITAVSSTDVQVAVNTATQYQALIPANGVVYAKDATTGKVMADLTSDNFNYGCTSVSVSRDQATAGAAAVAYNGNNVPANFVMAKRFTITPATNNASGNVTLKFYFTEAEIAAWEAATGKTRAALRVIKDGVAVPYTATVGAFGSNVTLTATLSNGLGGVYYFGSATTLSAASFEVVNAVTIYPNPTKDVLNINMPGADFGTSTKFTIYNSIGQVINNVNVNTQEDLKFNTANYSAGVYFIKIEKEGSVKTLQFIKE